MNSIDYVIIATYFIVVLAIGLLAARRGASQSVENYFLSGRKLPWWLAGISMVATTFAADTPLAVTGIIAKDGIAGNWIWWSFAASGMMSVFLFSHHWRRAKILTDAEFLELRYSGKPAAILRSFRAIYQAIPVNTIIIGWVSVGMAKVIGTAFDADKWIILLGLYAITGIYLVVSGLWGVVWTDLLQFIIAMAGSLALAWFTLDEIGSLQNLKMEATLSGGNHIMEINPFYIEGALYTVCAWLFVQWWATSYPGAEPGGGGYIAQRIFSVRNEKDAVKSVLLFNILHYVVRPWPWIIVALGSLALYPGLEDPETGYPKMMFALMPAGFLGLMVAGFLAAFMSTLSTHINWGASYLVNDIYKRHINPEASDKESIRVSRWSTLLILIIAFGVSYIFDTVKGAWELLLSIGAGAGPVYILRWYWWRINAWSEITAMISALLVSLFLINLEAISRLFIDDPGWFASTGLNEFGVRMLATVSITTIAWVTITFLTKPENNETLQNFVQRSSVSGPGWREFSPGKWGEILPRIALWLSSLASVYLVLIGIWHFLFFDLNSGLLALAAGVILIYPAYKKAAQWS